MTVAVDSFSPSAGKPREVMKSWLGLGIPLHINEPVPVTKTQLYQAHDRAYVDDVLACRIPNGFGNRSPEVAASLPWTSGAMLSAAREAIANGNVAAAPVSGFHHAGYFGGGGFCTMNGLMISAIVLLSEGIVSRVGILDLDNHYADGTDDIRQHLKLTAQVPHFTAGKNWHRQTQVKSFLQMLPELVEAFSECDLLLYQAGADVHVNDPMGGWMDSTQIFQRDKIVFETARQIGLPTCFNLAGGYQSPLRKVLDIHDGTLIACAEVFGITPCHTGVSQQ